MLRALELEQNVELYKLRPILKRSAKVMFTFVKRPVRIVQLTSAFLPYLLRMQLKGAVTEWGQLESSQ